MAENIAEARWLAVTNHDAESAGLFVYGVTSTRIYCRPGCASRLPLRKNTVFFSTPEEAQGQGFRSCKRCRPDQSDVINPSLKAVVGVCRYLEDDDGRSVAELAAHFGYSERHLRRLFKEIVGVSLGSYARGQRLGHVRDALHSTNSVTQAGLEAGYSSLSAFYEQGASVLGMTPKRFRDGGRGEQIWFTSIRTPLGVVFVGCTSRGLCSVRIGDREDQLEEELVREFPHATLTRDDEKLVDVAMALAGAVRGEVDASKLPLDVQGTAFQIRVWTALRAIPMGEVRTYSQVAASIGAKSSVRAVASACAANGVALTVPCHRVVRSDGSLSGYRWGVEKKDSLLYNEGATVISRAGQTR